MNIRAELADNLKEVPQKIADSEKLHDQLWSQVVKALSQTKDAKEAILLTSYIDSLNEVIDLHFFLALFFSLFSIPGLLR